MGLQQPRRTHRLRRPATVTWSSTPTIALPRHHCKVGKPYPEPAICRRWGRPALKRRTPLTRRSLGLKIVHVARLICGWRTGHRQRPTLRTRRIRAGEVMPASGPAMRWYGRPWKVLTYPAAHALLVNTTAVDSDGPADGHVGWVTGINVLTGTVTYIDMNGLDTCGPDQNGSCSYLFQSRTVPLKTLEASGDFFVLRQPGYEWSWGSGAYPATPRQCTESYTG